MDIVFLKKRLEVDQTKIEVIEKLPPPTNVKGIRSFLGHVGFYRRLIKDFSIITKPLCQLLQHEVTYQCSKECLKAFMALENALFFYPIIMAPDSSTPFEFIYDDSDFSIGVVLGQRHNKVFHSIHYKKILIHRRNIEKSIKKVLLKQNQKIH